jgi:tRNA(Ile)-lysidine synthase
MARASMPDSADPIVTVLDAVRAAFAAADIARSSGAKPRVLVALSGGRDSMALLDALGELADELSIALSAAHVHHGLSSQADAWAAFCAEACAARRVPLAVHRVRIVRAGGESLEAAARAARYAALATSDGDLIALAHHADDQAETMLLQLMRGAGPAGLAAMPLHRSPAAGPALFRPLLSVSRRAIDAYAQARGLAFVDDESNADTGLRRNFIRHEIAPRLAAAFPGYPATVVRAAAHQADASRLADDLARIDAANAIATDVSRGMLLDRGLLIALYRRTPYRARNLLRWYVAEHGLRTPSAARLAAMLDQLVNAAADSRVRLQHDGAEIGFYRRRIVVHPPAVSPFLILWRGERELALPHGTLLFAACNGGNADCAALDRREVSVRLRVGGERMQLARDRPRRALKSILRDAGMPAWQRESLPLVFCGDDLAAVPGIGVDLAFQAATGQAGYTVHWHRSNGNP